MGGGGRKRGTGVSFFRFFLFACFPFPPAYVELPYHFTLSYIIFMLIPSPL